MNVKQRRDCTIYAIIELFIALVYSYKNAVWVNEQYAMYFKRGDTSTPIYMMLVYSALIATVYKGNIIKNLIMDCQSYTKYRPNETTGGIFVSWRRKEELPTGA